MYSETNTFIYFEARVVLRLSVNRNKYFIMIFALCCCFPLWTFYQRVRGFSTGGAAKEVMTAVSPSIALMAQKAQVESDSS
jgi:hypothetical protein